MSMYRLLSTSGLLGYGFPEASLKAGMAQAPDMIGVDGGSTDPGPHYLGSGKCLNSRMATKRDLRLMLGAARSAGIPLVIGSCGGAGGDPHLEAVADIVREVAREDGHRFRLALIHSEQERSWVKDRMRNDRVRSLRSSPPLDDATVDRAERIVAMMGPEPFTRALDDGAEVILAGRSSDPAPWAACATRAQLPPAPAWYAGKMLECGATAAWPKGHDCLLVDVADDRIVVAPTNAERRCTPMSVANHSLHENASPVIHQEPGGVLDTTHCRFEAVNDHAVRVSGMEWRPDDVYTVKLEGAERVGYRAITFCGTRDPGLVAQFDSYLESVRGERRVQGRCVRSAGRRLHPDLPGVRQERGDGDPGAGDGHPGARARHPRRGDRRGPGNRECRACDLPHQRAPRRLPRPAVQGRQHGFPLLAVGHPLRTGLSLQRVPRGGARRSARGLPNRVRIRLRG